jgi:cytoskeletal protein RodZ
MALALSATACASAVETAGWDSTNFAVTEVEVRVRPEAFTASRLAGSRVLPATAGVTVKVVVPSGSWTVALVAGAPSALTRSATKASWAAVSLLVTTSTGCAVTRARAKLVRSLLASKTRSTVASTSTS